MVELIEVGNYKLLETKNQVKILELSDKVFAWINVQGIGEILVTSHNPHKTDSLLAVGRYRMYDVEDDPDFSDHIHLELSVGSGQWQGYLLLTGLPDDTKKRARIVPTHEVISGKKRALATSTRAAFV